MTEIRPAPRSWPRRLGLLLLTTVLGGAAYAWVHHERAAREQVAQLARDVQRLEAENAGTARIALQDKTGLAALATRFAALEDKTAALADTVQGGRLRVQAAAAELLLTAAAERVQIGRDPQAAARLLDLADRRLAAAADARLSPVRQAIAAERVALLAVPVADREGAALLLAALIQRSPQWPLQTDPLSPPSAAPSAPPASAAGQDWVSRAFAAARRALSGVFSLRRDDRRLRGVLGPEQESLLRQLLALKLEGARLALLRADSVSFRDLCLTAGALLAQDYRAADAGVAAARAELERLSRIELNPPLPETGRALALLRDGPEAR